MCTPADLPILLSKEHRILEKGPLDYRPFGIGPDGRKIRDVSGVTVRANVEYLEQVVSRAKGPDAGREAVSALCRLLNERITDPAYHVTPEFLRNPWNSYSYEFVMFLGEFCAELAGDPLFHFNVGRDQFISPLIQTLGRPFSVAQIYRMFPHFGQKFAKDSIEFGVGTVTPHSAVLRMKYTESVYRQFGPYRKRCAYIACQSSKAALGAVPERIHGLAAAGIKDMQCIAEGDDYCEWEITWEVSERPEVLPRVAAVLLGGSLVLLVITPHTLAPVATLTALAGIGALGVSRWRQRNRNAHARERLIEEQLRFVEARHEELREAYLDQEQATVELRRKIGELTDAYRQIEAFTVGLEQKVADRTAALQAANQELARLNQQLAEMNNLKSAFVSIVSHEVRTPLTSMKGYVENLLDGMAGVLTEKQRTYLLRLQHNVERLARMVNELLDLSRIEAGRLELQLRPIPLADSIRDAVESCRPLAAGKTIRLLDDGCAASLQVMADRDKLHQVLINVLHNAVKFTSPQGAIHVQAHPEGNGFVRISVSDTGCGIPPEELGRIFEKFYRSASVPTDVQGAGLGLAISKTLVELQGGRIWAESVLHEGSSFHLTLPACQELPS